MIQNCNFQRMVTFPTRRDNVLELFLTIRPTLINKCTLLPVLGDHDIVDVYSVVTGVSRWKVGKSQTFGNKQQECRQFQHKFTEQSSVNEMWNCFQISLLYMMYTHDVHQREWHPFALVSHESQGRWNGYQGRKSGPSIIPEQLADRRIVTDIVRSRNQFKQLANEPPKNTSTTSSAPTPRKTPNDSGVASIEIWTTVLE